MKGLAAEAIRCAAARSRRRSIRCQGRGGICPNPATQKTDQIPGVYCDICKLEVDRVIRQMRDYVEENNLIDHDAVVEKLKTMGFIVIKKKNYGDSR